MKVYMPFNMIIDTDSGVIRIIEELHKISHYSDNKIKSFLLKRKNENVISEYSILREIEETDVYDILLDGDKKYYKSVVSNSIITDLLSFVINTYKFGLTNEVDITIGCNYESEMEYLKSILAPLEYSIDMDLNENIKLNEYDSIFVKCLNKYYVDYLLDTVNIEGKRLYVADYEFNIIHGKEEQDIIIDPELHLRLESKGNVVSLVSLYNKK